MTGQQPGARAPIDFKDLASALLARAETLVPQWLPGGSRRGAEWVCGSLSGGAGHSCSVNLVNGRWADFGGDDAGGDLVALYAAVRGIKQGAAARELQQNMGWQAPLPAEPADTKPKKRRSLWVAQDIVPDHAPVPPDVWSYKDDVAGRWVELRAVRSWDYVWQGQRWGRVARFERVSSKTGEIVKDTLPQTWCEDSTTSTFMWRWKMWETVRPLYVPRGELSGKTVVVVEGEKCAAALHELCGDQVDAVSWPGGVNAVDKAHWEWLTGAHVVLWADTDSKRIKLTRAEKAEGVDPESKPLLPRDEQPGRAAMLVLDKILRGHECAVALIDTAEPGTLPAGWDVADAIADGWTADRVMAHINSALSPVPAPAPKLAVTLTDEPPAWAVEPVPADEGAAVAAPSRPKGGRGGDLMDVLLERFSLVYCDEVTAWDHLKRLFIKIPSMRTVFGREPVNQWLGSSNRHMVDLVDMVFEPGQTVPEHQINMFTGLEVQPIPCTADEVRPMLDLLRHLCAESAKNADEIDEIVHWILRWCALPLQQLGTKLQTAIVMHGPQGTGKNLFFDLMRDCYGEYGTTVGQTELEDKYNGWVSRKLFIVADEVVSRQEMFHKKNALKSLVTQEKKFPIRDMHKATRWESNHANLAFTSNESMPLALEDGDRRYMVIYTPLAADDELYQRVRDFKANGGLGKWLHYLQQYDLDGFDAHTKPIMTTAKEELIKTGWRASQRFAHDWMDGYLDLPVWPCSVEQLYAAFQRWCERSGERWPPSKETFGTEVARWAKETVQRDPMTGRRADPRIEKRVVNYALADGQRKSLRMWIPAGRMPPEGRAWGEWGLECTEAFQRPLDRYRSSRAGLQGDDE